MTPGAGRRLAETRRQRSPADAGLPVGGPAAFAAGRGLGNPDFARGSCGVGFIVKQGGVPDHAVVKDAVGILKNLEHRGSLGADKSTGDGAGIMIGIPDAFMRGRFGRDLPPPGDYAVGMVFLPAESPLRDRCIAALERTTAMEGCGVLGWRDVPVASTLLGSLAKSSQPVIRQVVITGGSLGGAEFERKLYVIRRLAEKEVASFSDPGTDRFYVCSLSTRTLVYKGLLTGSQMAEYYPDLNDPRMASSFAMVHARYSTNTMPTWNLAQPFRMLAHNGEINTLRGNVNRMRAREALMESVLLGPDLAKIIPVIVEGGSDSAMLDNVMELLTMAGRDLPHAAMMLVPEVWNERMHMSEDRRAFYNYHAALMEPWDGPAALAFSDGRYLGGILDRNGLRPARYTVTRDGIVVMASETGVMDLDESRIIEKGRLRPGRMLLVDLVSGRLVADGEIKAALSRRRPYRRWVREHMLSLPGHGIPGNGTGFEPDQGKVKEAQRVFGYTEEELKMVVTPMASNGQEPVGSMGDDAPLAVLSGKSQRIAAYFKQCFAQVTNPPIDPIREDLVMSLTGYLGREGNVLEEVPEHCRMLRLRHPVLTPDDMARLKGGEIPEIRIGELGMLFPAGGDGVALKSALDELFAAAERAVNSGATVLVLSDRGFSREMAPIPALLACAGLHHHLMRRGLRQRASLVVETGEAREVMDYALLVGYGASAVCPYLAFASVQDLVRSGVLARIANPEEALRNYIRAVNKGLLKVISRMGISMLRSYLGSQIFEAIGLGRELVDAYFCGTVSRIGGIGLREVASEAGNRHSRAYSADGAAGKGLDPGGAYRPGRDGERHLWNPESVRALHKAVRDDDYAAYREFARRLDDTAAGYVTLRSLLDFKAGDPVPLSEVEPVESLAGRFVGAAMSFGSISREAHEAVAVALNRFGGRSNSGEGGEDGSRSSVNDGASCSAVKQVASGRFGVTPEYLLSARELQIKMAQGAKPGEGGQLPGHKVSAEIARVRHTTPGVSLISPPPHHDIYSIEDLAQLIHDLKIVNPRALVSVKLVSEPGVGTVAAGVAKGNADLVLISGNDGGTGAAPLSSIKHVGMPWELGLAETQQTLMANGLRDRIRVQVDGGLRTGRDLAVAALLGAEEFGFGTILLVALGCALCRRCHLNTCPAGIATQDPALRARFQGKPEYVERLLRFLAMDLREHMARLGFWRLDDMIGRADLLEPRIDPDNARARSLDLGPLLLGPDSGAARFQTKRQVHPLAASLDAALAPAAIKALEGAGPVVIDSPVRNVHRSVGAYLSGEITRRHSFWGLPDGALTLNLTGSAGQSLGAFLAPGMSIRVEGEVNDYLGKGMHGGRIVVVPPRVARFEPSMNVIAGNTALYGATGGEAFIMGLAGERFAVRNSGALAVVEGVGDHGCEYMTGGRVVILGETGNNFAAGMTGGVAYVYDPSGLFDTRCNPDTVELESVTADTGAGELKGAIEDHYRFTGSPLAGRILADWDRELAVFVRVMPVEYRKAIADGRVTGTKGKGSGRDAGNVSTVGR